LELPKAVSTVGSDVSSNSEDVLQDFETVWPDPFCFPISKVYDNGGVHDVWVVLDWGCWSAGSMSNEEILRGFRELVQIVQSAVEQEIIETGLVETERPFEPGSDVLCVVLVHDRRQRDRCKRCLEREDLGRVLEV
jgi:hypothetical protein